MDTNITKSGYIEVTTNSFKIDGVAVAAPSDIAYEEHTMSRAWNDASGEQHKVNLRVRRKVIWKYSIIGRESLNKITNILNTKRDTTGSTRFLITTEYYSGVTDMTVEWGTPFKVECVDSMKDLFTCEISFIEPIGKKLPIG